MKSIRHLRKEFHLSRLTRSQLIGDALLQFESWLQQAVDVLADEATIMHLATVDREGHPHARIVLLKGIEDGELLFFTNYNSAKGHEMAVNAHVAVTFFWPTLERQVRIEGTVHKCNAEVSDVYFQSRPFESRVEACASPQSREVDDDEVRERFMQLQQKFADGHVPRPSHWGGYAIQPLLMEFWQGGANRLHDRFQYQKTDGGWHICRLAP